jgi:hypothetical protein
VGIKQLSTLALLALSCETSIAVPAAWERLQVHGFASQAIVQTSDNRYFGDSANTSFDFTELGLNASYQLSNEIVLSGQLLSRRAGEMYDGTPSIDYALVDLRLSSASDRRVGLRLGRIKNPLGLYNETRDVAFTRPSIFLPQSVYFDKIRNVLLSSDGAMFYAESFQDWGNLSLTLGIGESVIDENVEWTFLGSDFPGDLDSGKSNKIASLWYYTTDERLRVGLSGLKASARFKPNAPSFLDSGDIDVFYWIASLQYNTQDVTLSAEYARSPIDWKNFGPYFPLDQAESEGYYIQGAYRVVPHVEFMLRYEEGFADRNDRSGSRASALTGGATPPFDFYSRAWTAGLRWAILPNLMLRLEYQRQHGTYSLSFRENPDASQLVKDWDAFAASISFRF